MAKILKYFFILAGMGLLGADLYAFLWRVWFVRTSVKTLGTVVGLIPQGGGTSDGLADSPSTHSMTYAPRVRFHTLEGQEHTFTSAVSSLRPGYVLGDQVEIRYQPADPDSAEINSFGALWAGVVLAAFFAAAIIVAPWMV